MTPQWQRPEKAERGEYPYHYESPLRPWAAGEEDILERYGVEAIRTGTHTMAMDKPLPPELKHWDLVRYRPAGLAEARLPK